MIRQSYFKLMEIVYFISQGKMSLTNATVSNLEDNDKPAFEITGIGFIVIFFEIISLVASLNNS